MAVVVQVAKAEGAGAKMVLAVVFCALAGGNKAAVKLGMRSDTDLIAVVAGIEAALNRIQIRSLTKISACAFPTRFACAYSNPTENLL